MKNMFDLFRDLEAKRVLLELSDSRFECEVEEAAFDYVVVRIQDANRNFVVTRYVSYNAILYVDPKQ